MPVVPVRCAYSHCQYAFRYLFCIKPSIFEGIKDKVEVLDERVCFRYFDGRDITGFIDGTENPQFPR